MEDHANEGKKSPLDDIINHMTADWHTYGLPPGGGGGPAQAPAPHSSHVWTNWHGQGQTATPNPGQVPGQGTGQARQPQPYFMMGGGEPTLPVFFQADQPPPGYPLDPQAGKAQDFFSQPIQTAVPTDGNDVGGTMVDIGGGNFVKVRYSGGHGGTVNPQYLPVSAGSTVTNVIPPSLDNILPPTNQSESSRQHTTLGNNYGLFRELPSQQLIQNLVGNWTVPNQTGRYNPFGLALNESNDSCHENVKDVEPPKKNDKSVRRTRIIAEVRPMRPSYSAVLTTPSPAPSPLKPNMPVSPSNGHGQNNISSALVTNSVNKINSDTSRPKSTSSVSSGKGKNSSKSNGVVNQGSKLKRQHSNGNEEANNVAIKTGHMISTPKSSGLSSSSSADLDESALGNSSPTSLSRRWVSLDDLENEVDNPDSSQVFEEGGPSSEVPGKDGNTSDKKSADKASTRSGARPGLKQSSSSVSDEGFLNNKTPSGSGATKSGNTIGTNSTKRPIHINNNLGTNHGSHWTGQQSANQSSNPSKGDKTVRSSKSGRTGSDERKGAKNDGKSISGGSNSSGMSGRSGRGSMSSMADKAAVLQSKRNQRGSRRKDGVAAATVVFRKYGQLALTAIKWFFHLLSDVVGMSLRLSLHLCLVFWENWVLSTATWLQSCFWRIPQLLPERILHSRTWRFICKCLGKNDPGEQSRSSSKKSGRGVEGRESVIPGGLSHNISMPSTGEEAMKRLLACKGKDPYSILGVTPTCSDDDVKKYYKRQAFLVHPDKNNQPGAEEAFKILVHAFELIGEPEKRAEYDRYVAETQQVEQAWSELSDLLSQLHQKMEYAANTIRCTNCGKRHKRIAVPRKPFAARFCAQCKIKHSAKEGDIWAETMVMGFLWHYYACMEGAVYDITDWASCQTNNLRHLKPNSHTVQYRIVLGRQHQQNPRAPSEPDLENFLSSLYNQAGGATKGATGSGESSTSPNVPSRQDTARNRKKGKRNK
ncbi:DnaJ-like protein subfamily C member 14 [Frankliniella fusca]|uniref:DnaJ-like protein subfamily C member 14 n=1 Tax=Frankliniella fusca TaxID=407009 RepID=A0AAE1HJ30_9NEOP|nr:DnaJ-like protein subfamily C member 14 [Frankliniella fusca]